VVASAARAPGFLYPLVLARVSREQGRLLGAKGYPFRKMWNIRSPRMVSCRSNVSFF